jgi:hypothetical protein
MKAVINGAVLEGTPEEIFEYQMLHEQQMKKELMLRLSTHDTTWFGRMQAYSQMTDKKARLAR